MLKSLEKNLPGISLHADTLNGKESRGYGDDRAASHQQVALRVRQRGDHLQ